MARTGSAILMLGLLSLYAVSCRRPAALPPPAAPTPPVATTPPAALAPIVPPAPPTPPDPVASWSDPRVIAELAKNCAFDPDALSPEQREQWTGKPRQWSHDPLSCALGFDQSCVYDPCFDDERKSCRPRCTDTCRNCGKDCATACESCKKSCADDACRTACATSCATCRQDCLRTRDRCSTGTCAAEYRVCRRKLKSDWLKNGCPELCRAYLSCQKPCLRKHEKANDQLDACDKPCQPKDKHGCKVTFCGGAFGMGVDPLSWK